MTYCDVFQVSGDDMDEKPKKTIFSTTRTRFANRLVVATGGEAMTA